MTGLLRWLAARFVNPDPAWLAALALCDPMPSWSPAWLFEVLDGDSPAELVERPGTDDNAPVGWSAKVPFGNVSSPTEWVAGSQS